MSERWSLVRRAAPKGLKKSDVVWTVLFPLSPHRESGTSPFPLAVPYRAPPCPLMGLSQVPPSGVMVTARVS